MSVENATHYARWHASWAFRNVTTLGLSKPTQSDLPWLRRLERDATDIDVVVLAGAFWPVEKAPHSPSFVEGTLPSESGVIAELDATESKGDPLDVLVVAAELGDENAYLAAANQMDWSRRPASDLARGIRLALVAGAHLFARSLAAQGTKMYPGHRELVKMARILAPPRVVQKRLPPDPSVQANQGWLAQHAGEYGGLWVALDRGNLVATATTVAELRSRVDDLTGMFVTKVS